MARKPRGTDLFLGGGQHEVVLGMSQAHHHALHSVLAPSGQHTEEVNAKGTSQLCSAADEVQLLQQGQVEAGAAQPVVQAPPPPSCSSAVSGQAIGCLDSERSQPIDALVIGNSAVPDYTLGDLENQLR